MCAYCSHCCDCPPDRDTSRNERFICIHTLEGTIHHGEEDTDGVAPSVVRGACKMTC